MPDTHVRAIDQGTTGTRSVAFGGGDPPLASVVGRYTAPRWVPRDQAASDEGVCVREAPVPTRAFETPLGRTPEGGA